MKTLLLSLTLLSSMAVATGAVAGHHGKILTNKAGMTLYTFDKDSEGVSNCYGGCAQKWPPYTAKAGAAAKAGWGLTERKDGSQQWTYNNQPLYTWIGDSKAGDTNGDGVGGVWHIAEKVKTKSSSSYGNKYGAKADAGKESYSDNGYNY